MKKKIILIMILILFVTGIVGLVKTNAIKRIVYWTTSQPEEAPFRHM